MQHHPWLLGIWGAADDVGLQDSPNWSTTLESSLMLHKARLIKAAELLHHLFKTKDEPFILRSPGVPVRLILHASIVDNVAGVV